MAVVCDRLLHQKFLSFDNHCPPTYKEAINSLNQTKLHMHVIHAYKKDCILY